MTLTVNVMTFAEGARASRRTAAGAVAFSLHLPPLRIGAFSTEERVARALVSITAEAREREKQLAGRAPEFVVNDFAFDPTRAQVTGSVREGNVVNVPKGRRSGDLPRRFVL